MDKYAFLCTHEGSNNLTCIRQSLRFKTEKTPDFYGPYVLKPQFGGSSIGVEVVR
jgi:hypothetical protein